MTKTLLAISGTVLMLTALVAVPAQAAPVSTDCTVAPPDRSRLGAALAEDGLPAYATWLGSDRGREFNQAVSDAADRVLGVPKLKETNADRLRRGLIGTAVDDNTRTVVLVTAPGLGKTEQLRTELAAVAGSARNAGFKVRVMAGCRSAESLLDADRVIHDRAWHPDARNASYSLSLDAADSTYRITFDSRYPEAAQALRKALGDRAVVTLGEVGRAGRLDDGQSHFGGAGLRDGYGSATSNVCTAGFTVKRADGQKGGFTAGHCFANYKPIYSGPKFWGTTYGKVSYPAWDIIGLGDWGQTYDNVIHVDPCCPSQRNVTGRSIVKLGDLVCASGMVTRATCNIRVTNLAAEVCDADGCTTGLIEGWRSDQIIVVNGDSGGPVYVRSGTSDALAAGMIVGFRDGGRRLLAEHILVIEDYLNVTLLTS